MINQEYLKSILHYNPETGSFIWIAPFKNINVGDIAGTLNYGYIRIGINKKYYAAHRLIWLYMTGEWPKEEIDHIDMNRSNNRWINLRKATKSQNYANQKKYFNNTSGHKGVFWHKKNKKWLACLRYNKKLIYLGCYDNIDDAAKAYENAAFKYFGEFARTE